MTPERFPKIVYLLRYFFKWTLFALAIAVVTGSAAALFLISLTWVTGVRFQYPFLLYFLPLGGLAIGLAYRYFAGNVDRDSNLVFQEIYHPSRLIKQKVSVMAYLATVVTHLLGGSSGREGTAIEICASLSDTLSKIFHVSRNDRRIILITAISASFGAVYGTPITGAIFALEVVVFSSMVYRALYPAVLASILANYACYLWGVTRADYVLAPTEIALVSDVANTPYILYAALAGVVLGLAASLYTFTIRFFKNLFHRLIPYQPLIPFVGGVIFVAGILAVSHLLPVTGELGKNDFTGMGLETLSDSFTRQLPPYYWILKLFFTALTLGALFKGGGITPLFFVGATLGNAFMLFFPDVPMGFFAAIGLVGVFSAGANTPLAAIVMSMELFGVKMGIYSAVACIVAYLFSTTSGIYDSQHNAKTTIYS